MEAISIPGHIHPNPDVAQDYRPFLVIHKDGSVHRLLGTSTVPPSSDNAAAVLSKDVQISSSPAVSVRLYLPTNTHQTSSKLPLLIYFHGGGFVLESAQSPTYHNYLNLLTAEASAVVISVDYRLAPEYPLPAAYDDSWSAVLWAASLSDPWVSQHADLSRVFFAGDSAGGNIVHHMAVRFGSDPPAGMDLIGVALVHPFFTSSDYVHLDGEEDPKKVAEKEFGARFWNFLCPDGGMDHPWVNPTAEGKLGSVGAHKAVVFVAEMDSLRERGVWYADELRKSVWAGKLELIEAKGEDHVFHLFNPANPNSVQMMTNIVHFINTN